jgi:sterol desaturase/sphingolipid hydroxylase (fatty acid hydroxylase superfamily)
MTTGAPLSTGLASIGLILLVMALVAAIEALIPLHARGRWGRAHLWPNLALTVITFATNLVLNAGLVFGLVWLQARGLGLLNAIAVAPWVAVAIVVLGLDFAFYLAHRAMHRVPSWWRVHSVHHCDPFVDVTTTIRQHPLEGLIRYGFMSVFAFALGAGPAAFAVYRLWSTLAGLAEHANVRLPAWLDRLLVLFVSTPNMHKIHHSRRPDETDSNFSNVTSLWDRLFFTYTPSRCGVDIPYGLDGHDERSTQTTLGLLALPFRRARARRRVSGYAADPVREPQ